MPLTSALPNYSPSLYVGRQLVHSGKTHVRRSIVRVPGQPANVGSVFATYSFRRDAGVTIGTTAVSSVNAGYVSGVRLPGYLVWRGSTYFQRGNWGINVSVNNIFNAEYYQSQFLFWDVFIKPSELRTVNMTMNWGF